MNIQNKNFNNSAPAFGLKIDSKMEKNLTDLFKTYGAGSRECDNYLDALRKSADDTFELVNCNFKTDWRNYSKDGAINTTTSIRIKKGNLYLYNLSNSKYYLGCYDTVVRSTLTMKNKIFNTINNCIREIMSGLDRFND